MKWLNRNIRKIVKLDRHEGQLDWWRQQHGRRETETEKTKTCFFSGLRVKLTFCAACRLLLDRARKTFQYYFSLTFSHSCVVSIELPRQRRAVVGFRMMRWIDWWARTFSILSEFWCYIFFLLARLITSSLSICLICFSLLFLFSTAHIFVRTTCVCNFYQERQSNDVGLPNQSERKS